MDIHLIAYYIGIFTIFASHIYLFAKPEQTPDAMKMHSVINIIAALLIAYYFMNKEGFIRV